MRSYFKFLSNNKLYALIEAFGLSVALGFVILLFSYARTEYSVGKMRGATQPLYVVGSGDFLGMTLGTADAFFPDLPEITRWTRMAPLGTANLRVGEVFYAAEAVAVDTNFFSLFDYELSGCDRRQVLTTPREALLSRSFARRVFGTDSPIGRILTFHEEPLTVTGIVDDFGPGDPFIPCDLFLSMRHVEGTVQPMDQFGSVQTFVTLSSGADPAAVSDKLLERYLDYWSYYKRDRSSNTLMWGSTLTPLDEVYFSPLEKYAPYRSGGNPRKVRLLLMAAMVLLVSALFNYVNLSVALTGKRAKEMTTRRVLGESDRGILLRYVGESLLFTTGCFLLGCLIAWMAKPLFERWLETGILLQPDLRTVLLLLVSLPAVALLSAWLPTTFILRFKPIDVVKGRFRFKSKMYFSRLFIVAQHVLSTFLIAVALTMLLQVRHLSTLPYGYRTDKVLVIPTARLGYDPACRRLLQQRLESLPQVRSVGRAMQIPANCGHNGVHDSDGRTSWLRFSQLDSTAFHILGFHVLAQYEADVRHKIWLDEEGQRRYGVDGHHTGIGGTSSEPKYRVCGVVADYRSRDALYEPINDSHNALYMLGPDDPYFNFLVEVSCAPDQLLPELRRLCREVTQTCLGYPVDLEIRSISELINDRLEGTRHLFHLLLAFMFTSLLISVLGLLAMSVHFTRQRRLEIALRKVMGASVGSVVWQLSAHFLFLTLIAVLIAFPISLRAMDRYLQDFYNRIDFPWWVLAAALLCSCTVCLLAVGVQVFTAAMRNPMESLQHE